MAVETLVLCFTSSLSLGIFPSRSGRLFVFDKVVKPRNGAVLEDDSSIEVVDLPAVNGGVDGGSSLIRGNSQL